MTTANSWVYIRTEPGLYTVGFYGPGGKWNPDSDHATQDEARQRTHWLNGGNHDTETLNTHPAATYCKLCSSRASK